LAEKHAPPIAQTCDFHVFGPLKDPLGGRKFNDDAVVEAYARNWLLTRPTSFYDDGISKLPIRWEKCVSKAAECIEK